MVHSRFVKLGDAATIAALWITLASFAAPAEASTLYIQPIKICDDGGSNCANAAEELYLTESNKIWAQAGITLQYLAFTSVNSSALSLDDAGEVASLFTTAPGAAGNPLIVSMWFVADHYIAYGEVEAIPGNKVVINQLTFDVGRLDTIAHEIGHLLGLFHDDPGVGTDFLTRSGVDRVTPSVIGDITPDGAGLDKLTAAQILTAQSDLKLDAIPEPTTFTLMVAGFVAIAVRRRKGFRV